MIPPDVRWRLDQFFEGTFHQDWLHDDPTEEQAIVSYVSRARDPQDLPQLCDDLTVLLEEVPNDEQMARYLHREISCNFNPALYNLGNRQWVELPSVNYFSS